MNVRKLFQAFSAEGLIHLTKGVGYFFQGRNINLKDGWYVVDLTTGFIYCKLSLSDEVIEEKISLGEILEVGLFSLMEDVVLYYIVPKYMFGDEDEEDTKDVEGSKDAGGEEVFEVMENMEEDKGVDGEDSKIDLPEEAPVKGSLNLMKSDDLQKGDGDGTESSSTEAEGDPDAKS